MQTKKKSPYKQGLLIMMCILALTGCDGGAKKGGKKQEAEQSAEKRHAEIMATVQKGPVLLSRSTIGEVTLETYEIPRPYYVLGKAIMLEKGICVVYLKPGLAPVMECDKEKLGSGS